MKSKQNSPSILIITANTGHMSIAEAISDCLKQNGLSPKSVNLSDSFFNLYTPFYLYFPQLFKIPYKIGEYKRPRQLLDLILKAKFATKLTNLIRQTKPDYIISTWCFANPVIEQLTDQFNFKFLNIITDPRTIHSFIPSHKAVNFAFDQIGADYCRQIGIPKDKIVKSGWIVRDRFEAKYNSDKIRKQLNLPTDQPVFLIAAGSEGTHFVLKILPTFINASKPVTAVFACGKNKRLLQIINQSNKVKDYLNRTPSRLITLEFTPHIDEYIKAADLVIGKAGPNLLFETIATHTPFFAITHISGQEDGNLDLIRENKLGFVEENPIKANQLLQHIIDHPEQLKDFQPSLKKLANYNRRSRQILLNHIIK